jgi:hypothetical protein
LTILQSLPAIYSRWFQGTVFAEVHFHEREATCFNCPMTKAPVGSSKDANQKIFKSDLKCCTFFPTLANFQVGTILKENGPGAARIRRLLQNEPTAALPLAVIATQGYQQLFRLVGAEEFGQNPDLLCPYSERGRCLVWTSRAAPCVGYICKSSFGKNGIQLWKEIEEFLLLVEMTLAHWALSQMGFTQSEIEMSHAVLPLASFSQQSSKSATSPEIFAKAWLEFSNQKEDFYLSCWQHIENLSFQDFWQLLGEEGEQFMKGFKNRLIDLKEENPRFEPLETH